MGFPDSFLIWIGRDTGCSEAVSGEKISNTTARREIVEIMVGVALLLALVVGVHTLPMRHEDEVS